MLYVCLGNALSPWGVYERNSEKSWLSNLCGLEDLLGYTFKNQALLCQALTHRSFVNEREAENLRNNESLEFLGDSVLGFLISSRIFKHCLR